MTKLPTISHLLNDPESPLQMKTYTGGHSAIQLPPIRMGGEPGSRFATPSKGVVHNIPTPVSKKNSKKQFAFISHSQDTFLGQEPTVDNEAVARRKRRRTSKYELDILNAEFAVNHTPNKHKRSQIAERCNMDEKAVQIWFQNKRQNVKRAMQKQQEEGSPSTPPPAKTHVTTPGSPGKALTFRLDKKDLSPVNVSPNNKINRLINGPLRDLDVNTIDKTIQAQEKSIAEQLLSLRNHSSPIQGA